MPQSVPARHSPFYSVIEQHGHHAGIAHGRGQAARPAAQLRRHNPPPLRQGHHRHDRHAQDQFWSQPRDHTIEIKSITHDKVMFKVPPVSSEEKQPKRKLLLDAYGVLVVGMEEHNVPSPPSRVKAFAVIPDGFAATKELFRFKTRLNVFNDMPLHLNFKDEDSFDAPTRVVVMGRWRTRQVPIAIQRDGGDFFMIARVYPVGRPLDGKYRMDIAPGVDFALMVLFAAAMDQETHKVELSSDRVRLRKLLKDEARQEKKRLKAQERAGGMVHTAATTAAAS